MQQRLPVTITEESKVWVQTNDACLAATLELTVGRAKLRVDGNVNPALLAQVLGRLHYVLAHIAEHPVNQVDDLLPWNCAAALANPR